MSTLLQVGMQRGALLTASRKNTISLSRLHTAAPKLSKRSFELSISTDKKPKITFHPIAANRAPATQTTEAKTAAVKKPLSNMKICVLQSSYEGSNYPTENYDDTPDPALFTAQHEFHHRYLKKATAEAEIDAAIAEGFDLFFNFMWGQPEDDVAGLDAILHLESKNVPFVGLNSTTLMRSKLDFYSSARAAGLPVPASGPDMKFPVFVKPAKMCASIFIDEHSVCRDQAELDLQIKRINEFLAPRRLEVANGNSAAHTVRDGVGNGSSNHTRNESISVYANGTVEDYDDIVVQEYIPGRDYSVVVIEMGNTPVAMTPTRHRFPAEVTKDFQTFDVKFHPKLKEEALVRSVNPELFDGLRKLAEQAWHVNKMQGGSWCNVDVRERSSDGKLFALEVNSVPAIFYRWENEWEDVAIRNLFPGGHRALINVVITTTLLQAGKHKDVIAPITSFFDEFSPTYDSRAKELSKYGEITDSLVAAYDYSGSVLDLGCGTGLFGRKLHAHQKQHGISPSSVVGNDISQLMVEMNPIPESYKEYKIGTLQEVIMNITEPFDHIVSLSAFQYLDDVTFSAVLARIFLVAQKSVTFTVDEVPESLNEAWKKSSSLQDIRVWNHIAQVEGFGVPRGWRVASRERRFGWTSPNTGIDVNSTTFRFEALKPCTPCKSLDV